MAIIIKPVFLKYDIVWKKYTTQPFQFERLIIPQDAYKLEKLRELTIRRQKSVQQKGYEANIPMQNYIDWFDKYLTYLNKFIQESLDALLISNSKIGFEWNSPLNNQFNKQFRVPQMEGEQIMAYFMYALALHERTFQNIDTIKDGSEDLSSQLLQQVNEFKYIAGIFQYIGDQLAVKVQQFLPSERPSELIAAMSLCWKDISLGQAQILVAYRASLSGTSPLAIATLYKGAQECFDNASYSLKSSRDQFSSLNNQIKQYLAILSCASESYSRCYQSIHFGSKDDYGQATLLAEEAEKLFKNCLKLSDGRNEYKQIIRDALRQIEKFRKDTEDRRSSVYFQKKASLMEESSQPKVLVKLTPYQPHAIDELVF